MLKILFSYGKGGQEGRWWADEIARASNSEIQFVPFNHRELLKGKVYETAEQLDRDFRGNHPALRELYSNVLERVERQGMDCLFVTNDNVYHPDFLLKLGCYRVIHTTDDPGSTYSRTIPYLHAFHHAFHCAIPYAPGKTLNQKLLEAGVRRADFLPLGFFDFEFDPAQTAESILARPRDIDLIYIGNPFFAQKFEYFLQLSRAFRNLKIAGFWRAKHSVYLSLHSKRFRWVRPVSMEERVRLYQRAKIGFNVHWDAFGLGNQRLYHLPANGVMQISDCPEHLGEIFEKGVEVVAAETPKQMIETVRYYLEHDEERSRIALAGFKRAMAQYRIGSVMVRAGNVIQTALKEGSHR